MIRNHADLCAVLEALGWTRIEANGKVFYRVPDGSPADRAVQMIDADPAHALCMERGTGNSLAGLAETALWARCATPNA